MEGIFIGNIKRWLGPAMIVLSFLFYGALILVPFVTFSAGNKVLLSFLLVILGESSFWIAVLILGKQAVSKYCNYDWRSKIFEPLRELKKKM
jgi:hypothetical protein